MCWRTELFFASWSMLLLQDRSRRSRRRERTSSWWRTFSVSRLESRSTVCLRRRFSRPLICLRSATLLRSPFACTPWPDWWVEWITIVFGPISNILNPFRPNCIPSTLDPVWDRRWRIRTSAHLLRSSCDPPRDTWVSKWVRTREPLSLDTEASATPVTCKEGLCYSPGLAFNVLSS